jgi:hypothetical protein
MKREELLTWRANLQKKIDAIDVLLETDGVSEAVVSGKPLGRPLKPRPKMLIEAVDEATALMNSNFTSAEVLSYVAREYPHLEVKETKHVGGPLATLLKRGKIEYDTKGHGNIAHVYRRVRPQQQHTAAVKTA